MLLPETEDTNGDGEEDQDNEAIRQASLLRQESESRPLKDEELDVLGKRGGIRGKSYAERLPKPQRRDKVARLTAYCTAQAYKMKSTAEFLRTKHEAKTKLYDDCLYTVYHLPLLPGLDGYRIRSRPILKSPGSGKTVLDLEIERSERRDEHEGYFDEYSYGPEESPTNGRLVHHSLEDAANQPEEEHEMDPSISPLDQVMADAKNFAEMFVFSYGVVVFWNFTENQEKDILADLTFAANETGTSLRNAAA